MALIKQSIVELNLFENEHSQNDPLYRRIGIISTRFYLMIFTLTILIIIVYTTLGTQTEIISITKPSYRIYRDLYKSYGNSLTCPCRSIANAYGLFVSVSHDYHPVCSSAFVSNNWLKWLFNTNMSYFFPLDFRSSAFGQFQLLASFCTLLKRFVDDALANFYLNTLLTTEIYSMETLNAQSVSQSSFVYNSIIDETQRLFTIIRRTTHSNRLHTAMQTNKLISLYIFVDSSVLSSLQGGLWLNRSGDFCVCDSNPTCSSNSGFFNLFAYESEGLYVPLYPYLETVTGFVSGCYALESLLQSTLQCLFDEGCLAIVYRFFSAINQTYISPININITRFTSDTNVHTLLNELLLEYWMTNTSFEDYFNACSPISCSYTIKHNNTFLFVLTTLLSLYGGLTVALHLAIPPVVGWWYRGSQVHERDGSEYSFIEKIRYLLKSLNIFKNARTVTDAFEKRTAIIATRLFIVCLILCMIIIVIYNLTITRTRLLVINPLSQAWYEDLYDTFSETLECQCNHTAALYGSFLSISPMYHPICSSLLISNVWMNSIAAAAVADFTYDIQDFHIFGNTFFATLSMLCSLAETTVTDAWFIFKQFTLVSPKLLSKNELIARARLLMDQFQSNTLTQFVTTLNLIQIQSSNVLSTIQGNVYLASYDRINNLTQRIDFHWVPRQWNNCSCFLNDTCTASVGFFIYPPNYPVDDIILKFYIPQFYLSCSAIQSVLQSSLICFFNQSCLDNIQNELNSNISVHIPALHSNKTRFSPESLMKAIVHELMIEHWNDLIQYENYYAKCRPKLCTYRLTSRDDFFYVISVLISLLGGLTAALKLIIPLLVGVVRNRLRHQNTNPSIANHPVSSSPIRAVWQIIKNKLVTLNIFDTEDTWFDHHRRFRAIIATRIYIVLLTITLVILTIYNLFATQIQYYTVQNPPQSVFEELHSNELYSSTLDCPCQTIAISYGSFVTIVPDFHQFCLSDFLTKNEDWINLLYYPWLAFFYSYTDFRLFAAIQFRLLNSFCHTTNATVTNALIQFLSNTLISSRVQTRLNIEKQTNIAITHFRRSTSQTFTKIFDSIRQIMHGNGIVSGTLSNWHFLTLNVSTSWTALWSEPRSYGDCSCGLNANCTSPAYIDQRFIRGFLVGCDPLEALLQSTLACLYDITCIFTIKYMYIAANLTMRPLDRSLSDPNATVQSLLENMMINQWKTNIDYQKYYQVCAARLCTYSMITRPNVIFVITTIIGLFGGLNVALKILVPKSVQLMLYILNHGQNRVRSSICLTSDA